MPAPANSSAGAPQDGQDRADDEQDCSDDQKDVSEGESWYEAGQDEPEQDQDDSENDHGEPFRWAARDSAGNCVRLVEQRSTLRPMQYPLGGYGLHP